jgi:hypothetical protein
MSNIQGLFMTFSKIVTILCLVPLAGCANVRVTNPSRTATEQFLLSQAAIDAVNGFSFNPLFGRKVYVDESHFAPAEKEFVLGELRAALLKGGVQIMSEADQAEIVVEVRSSGVGIDRYENLLGVPPLAAPAGAAAGGNTGAAMSTLITPELAITKNIRQYAFASIAYIAYWQESGEVVASEGPSVGKAWREDWWLLGMGPKSVGNVITTDTEPEY